VARLFQLKGYTIDIRKVVRSNQNEPAEIDVKANYRMEIVCVECKGKAPGSFVDASEIREWIETPLPRIKSWLKLGTSLPEQRRFEFYTSTDYTDDARVLIAEIQRTHTRQPIRFRTGQDVIAALRKERESGLVEIFREQFGDK
jgi:hypothetical protein